MLSVEASKQRNRSGVPSGFPFYGFITYAFALRPNDEWRPSALR